ncbi:MAG: heme biosynthesis HemY N-terminal domain-containing protein, partial [Pseudomonadota bacterium]
MLKILSYALKIAILVAVGYWLVEHPGQVTLEWQGYLIETSTPVAFLALLFGIAVIAVIYHLYRKLLNMPGIWGLKRGITRRGKGYEALTKGLIAVAAGDGTMARKQTEKARKLLNDAPLTLLLAAQAAQLNDNHKEAQESFRRMLDQPELAFFGVRGLLTHSLRQDGRRDPHGGVNREALTLARKAFRLEPSSPWVVETLFDLEMLAEEYDRGLGLVDQMRRVGLIDKATATQRRGVIFLARSMTAERRNRERDAMTFAKKAAKLAPGFAPAAMRYAGLLHNAGKNRKAYATIDKAWQINPHPELAALWLAYSPYEEQESQLTWMRRLCSNNGIEDHIALAPLLLKNGIWDEARKRLTSAYEAGGGSRALRMLADLEIKESNDTLAASQWLDKAGQAAPSPCWVSLKTGATQNVWTPFTDDTGHFDALDWLVPAPAGTAAPSLPAPSKPAPLPLNPPAAPVTIDAEVAE